MTAKRLKEWAKHLFNMADKCDKPTVKAFILGKADAIGLEYLNRKYNDEEFKDLLLSKTKKYYTKWYKIMDKYI